MPSDGEAVPPSSDQIHTPPKAKIGGDDGAAKEGSVASEVDQAGGAGSSPSSTSSQESGEASPITSTSKAAEAPPLPNEPPPTTGDDDGWDFHWDATHQAYFFHNRITGASTWENPRLAGTSSTAGQPAAAAQATSAAPGVAEPPKNERPPAGGYNPAIHGDYDPNAWYAQPNEVAPADPKQPAGAPPSYAASGSFNRFTGRWQADSLDPEQHNDENKSRRQMNAFFDVDAAANSHDGRSLKAERSGKKPSKAELKQFKEKRRAKKDEKRRAWLMD
jgi:hypothetical protein